MKFADLHGKSKCAHASAAQQATAQLPVVGDHPLCELCDKMVTGDLFVRTQIRITDASCMRTYQGCSTKYAAATCRRLSKSSSHYFLLLFAGCRHGGGWGERPSDWKQQRTQHHGLAHVPSGRTRHVVAAERLAVCNRHNTSRTCVPTALAPPAARRACHAAAGAAMAMLSQEVMVLAYMWPEGAGGGDLAPAALGDQSPCRGRLPFPGRWPPAGPECCCDHKHTSKE